MGGGDGLGGGSRVGVRGEVLDGRCDRVAEPVRRRRDADVHGEVDQPLAEFSVAVMIEVGLGLLPIVLGGRDRGGLPADPLGGEVLDGLREALRQLGVAGPVHVQVRGVQRLARVSVRLRASSTYFARGARRAKQVEAARSWVGVAARSGSGAGSGAGAGVEAGARSQAAPPEFEPVTAVRWNSWPVHPGAGRGEQVIAATIGGAVAQREPAGHPRSAARSRRPSAARRHVWHRYSRPAHSATVGSPAAIAPRDVRRAARCWPPGPRRAPRGSRRRGRARRSRAAAPCRAAGRRPPARSRRRGAARRSRRSGR